MGGGVGGGVLKCEVMERGATSGGVHTHTHTLSLPVVAPTPRSW